ncbi:hypothetical protein SELMODRAFT_408423 [Selaginella moellendorffii]|uniref:Uncharacterized protein n=1 Tax=Selaginella moellendorffii TaxID=88036 RepID=D8R891_SELML|nr:protein EXORDIUM-like 2 [Selaginella moellendorffii]EFJ32021.1 hypothetical protein SELMODRAFT_408423 [Selaginella moellendorffii]|eukprot:XP_002967422.1 protein EXORDIUM-like 2 [Selaginella moellendorffii]
MAALRLLDRPMLLISLLLCFSAFAILVNPCAASRGIANRRHLSALVKDPPLVLDYHNGELLSGAGSLNVYAIWYGDFQDSHKSAIADFFASFQDPATTVSSWWKITSGYKDASGASIFPSLRYAGHTDDAAASLGRSLKPADLESLLSKSLESAAFPTDPKALYLVLTAAGIDVEGFCVQSCASHRVLKAASGKSIAYAWIGDSSSRCPGKCAWPYANPKDFGGPDTKALVAPNGVGVDGMVINIAAMVAGATSNPFGTGYFQGPSTAPLEAVTACPGIFGQGAYSGYPGQLLSDAGTGASYNARGSNARHFLLPALWNPSTLSCAYPSS